MCGPVGAPEVHSRLIGGAVYTGVWVQWKHNTTVGSVSVLYHPVQIQHMTKQLCNTSYCMESSLTIDGYNFTHIHAHTTQAYTIHIFQLHLKQKPKTNFSLPPLHPHLVRGCSKSWRQTPSPPVWSSQPPPPATHPPSVSHPLQTPVRHRGGVASVSVGADWRTHLHELVLRLGLLEEWFVSVEN